MPTSSPGSVRFVVGGGVLTVANDLVVFVSPAGPVADAWSDLAQTPASEAEIRAALASEIPADHHLALLHLVDAGAALLAVPGSEPITGSVRRAPEGVISFGMQTGPADGFWIGAGVVGASGFELSGFVLDEAEPGSSPTPGFFTAAPPPPPPPPVVTNPPSTDSARPGTTTDSPVLSASLFADLPTESDRAEGRAHPLSVRFDDGKEVALAHPLAVGRAPEGSADVPDGAVVVVVSGDQVSRCHFVIRPTNTGAEVIDTNSLNGCFLDEADRPGSGPQIPVGVPVEIEPGQRLRFGDRSLTVIVNRNAI